MSRLRTAVHVGLLAFCVGAAPARAAKVNWEALYAGDGDRQLDLARGVELWVDEGVSDDDFHAGGPRFDSEWRFGTEMMAALGFGQVILDHPERREELVPEIRKAAADMLSPAGHVYDSAAWGVDPLDDLAGDGHVAFLGYTALALAMELRVDPSSPDRAVEDRLIAAIVARLDRRPGQLVATYPGEWYPVDNAAAIGALGLYDRATGADHRATIARWSASARASWIEPSTGLLIQAYAPYGAHGPGRGSGTFLASYFLSFADPALSGDLYAGGRRTLAGSFLGFFALREYAPGVDGGMDVDSGPIVGGYGMSSSGFALGAARASGDADTYRALGSLIEAFGAPYPAEKGTRFATGGPIGDAILLAMATARPAGT